MVISHGKEILGAGALVQGNQFFRIPIFSFPVVNNFFKTSFGRMPVMSHLPVVLRAALFVHKTGIPVALFGLALAPRAGMSQLPWLVGAAWASLLVATATTVIWVLVLVRRSEAGEVPASRAAQVGAKLV